MNSSNENSLDDVLRDDTDIMAELHPALMEHEEFESTCFTGDNAQYTLSTDSSKFPKLHKTAEKAHPQSK